MRPVADDRHALWCCTHRPADRRPPDGNGYVFAAYDAGAMLDTIGQAVGLYHGDAEGFRMVRRRGMEGDFSWDRSAGAYRNIYGKLLGR